MSINARIAGVSVNEDGTVRLSLKPWSEDCAGQKALTVTNPPEPPSLLEACIGTHIWGGAGLIMIGETEWAKRVSYAKIELVSRKG